MHFFKWQLSQTFFPREQVVPFIGTTRLVAKKGLTGITANIYAGLEDFSEMGFLLHFLQADDLFADIGANAGSYTVLASGYSRATTVAFEPVPSTYEWLQKNIKENQLQQLVRSYNAGVGSKNGQIRVTNNFGTINHVVSATENLNEDQTTEVPIFTLDFIMESFDKKPSLIKIDVEGFETEVIAGMSGVLHSHVLKAIIIELNGSGSRYGYDENRIHQQLLELSFLPYQYDPFKRELRSLQQYGSHNTIYIRDKDVVMERLKSAKKVASFSEFF